MTGQQLKNSILQMAVQGKLVSQDPADEPASVLLERIRAEKEALIKAGKIKKEKNPSVIFRGADNLPYEKVGNSAPVCIADEVPFEIPDSWEWVRFCNLVNYSMGKTPPRKESEYWDKTDYNWVSIADMVSDGHISQTKEYVSQYASDSTFKGKISPYGTLLMSFKLTVGKVSILDINAYHNEAIISIFPYVDDNRIMTQYLFKTMPLLSQLGETKTAIKGNTLNSESLDNLLIPLPPLKEQQRIFSKLNELMIPLENYAFLHVESENLNKSFPEQLKKSILQEAVQGKLVPQDENDEPASVLLECIRQEKDALVKAGKIKKDKHESVIFRRDNSHYEKLDGVERCIDDEIPFDIPDSWEWVRLGQISSYAETKLKINAKNADKFLWELDLEDIEKGGSVLRFKTVMECDAKGEKTFFKQGDILYSKLRPYLLKILVAPEDGICTPEIVPFKAYGNILPEYIVMFLKSPSVDSYINSITYGIKMPRVGTDTMVNLLVPLPPLEEQHRIVNRINKLTPNITCLTQ